MSELKALNEAMVNLSSKIMNFPVSIDSSEKSKPIDERIANMRARLQQLHATKLTVKAEALAENLSDEEPSKQEWDKVFEELEDVTTDAILERKTVSLLIHGHALEAAATGRVTGAEGIEDEINTFTSKMIETTYATAQLNRELEKAFEEQLDLKIKCQKALQDYQKCLRRQKLTQKENLKLMTAHENIQKKKMHKAIRKINIMKRLITSFIAASGEMLTEEPVLVDMLEKHRNLVTIETVTQYVPDSSEDS